MQEPISCHTQANTSKFLSWAVGGVSNDAMTSPYLLFFPIRIHLFVLLNSIPLFLTYRTRCVDDIPRKEWPAGLEEEIMLDFDVNADGSSSSGDRRQEIVFIGQFGDNRGNSQQALEEVLDSCLLSDDELVLYEANKDKGDPMLRSIFFAQGQQ